MTYPVKRLPSPYPHVAGFTLLVVMVIIGLLTSYVAPRYFDQIGKSEAKVARAQLDVFDKALGTYRLDADHYPSTKQGWLELGLDAGKCNSA